MEFNPNNNIIKLCLQGMHMEENARPGEAGELFLQAWNEATNDYEKFLSSYYVARSQKNVPDKLRWFQSALQFALQADSKTTSGVFAPLYSNIAKCFEELKDLENAKMNYELAASFEGRVSDEGPFYHGTKADLQVGDSLTAGYQSNYKSELTMNHIYFTALVNGAGLAAELAKGDRPARVYIVEPTGGFENDPNVTDKKFPGNPTRSYRTQEPLKIIGEITDWERQTPEQLQKWQEKLANIKGDIIN